MEHSSGMEWCNGMVESHFLEGNLFLVTLVQHTGDHRVVAVMNQWTVPLEWNGGNGILERPL